MPGLNADDVTEGPVSSKLQKSLRRRLGKVSNHLDGIWRLCRGSRTSFHGGADTRRGLVCLRLSVCWGLRANRTIIARFGVHGALSGVALYVQPAACGKEAW